MATYLPVINRTESMKLDVSDICLVLRDNRKIQLDTVEKRITTYDRMEHIEQFLNGDFLKCMEGCIINLAKISSMSDTAIIFDNGMTFKMGKNNYIKVKQKYNAYLRNLLPPRKDGGLLAVESKKP